MRDPIFASSGDDKLVLCPGGLWELNGMIVGHVDLLNRFRGKILKYVLKAWNSACGRNSLESSLPMIEGEFSSSLTSSSPTMFLGSVGSLEILVGGVTVQRKGFSASSTLAFTRDGVFFDRGSGWMQFSNLSFVGSEPVFKSILDEVLHQWGDDTENPSRINPDRRIPY